MKYLLLALTLIAFSMPLGASAQTQPSQPSQLSQHERDSAASNLAPIPGKAIVYILRTSLVGLSEMARIDCDSFQVGWVGVKSYVYTIVDPGEHRIFCNLGGGLQWKQTLEGGKIYYLQIRGGAGTMKVVDEEKGRKYLRRCGLSKHNRYPEFPPSRTVERDPPSGS